jgi:Domain of Unknown Function with PDB structure (DUF3857)/Transglutaminase-like superfamily
MQITWSFICWKKPKAAEALTFATAAMILAVATGALASTPEWLRQAAQTPLPSYPDDANAVVLLDERITTVTPGEIRTTYRKAYKILRPQGRRLGTVIVRFDNETQLAWFKGWSITSRNEEYEVKDKDAIETSMFSETLYADTRYKLLQIPAPDPGSVVGYEYQQRERSSLLQVIWPFQGEIPVRHAHFVLELPPGWSYVAHWINHAEVKPQSAAQNHWSWDLTDVAPIEVEPEMPPLRAVAGHLGIALTPPGSASSLKSYRTWEEIGRWYMDLSSTRREVTSQLRDKARELTVGAVDPIEKTRRIAAYVQHAIRYVAIEIGIGGYQPHTAQEVFSSGYGDCKDKATLLSALLREVGIDSYYVLINSDRDVLTPEFPSMLSFNHVILAINLSQAIATPGWFATIQDSRLGPLLFFDPTDNLTPLGYLPPTLQSNYGLIVTKEGGELVKLPLLPPSANRLRRIATLELDSSGNLKGSIQETRTGSFATSLRAQLLATPKSQREKVFQRLLAKLLDRAVLSGAAVSSLDSFEDSLGLEYKFTAYGYGQRAGELILFRPSALGRKSRDVLEGKVRKQPLAMSDAASESDVFDISFPAGFAVDELPAAVRHEIPFATYTSASQASEHVLHYSRTLEMKDVRLSVEQLDGLQKLFREMADDERTYTVLKVLVPERTVDK